VDISVCSTLVYGASLIGVLRGGEAVLDTPWDIRSLRAYAKTKHPEDSAELVLLINAIGHSQILFEYHKRLARDAFQGFKDPSFFVEHQMRVGEQQGDWDEACVQSEANLIACVSTALNSLETFGKLLEKLELTTGSGNLHKVLRGLPNEELRQSLDETITSDGYKYLRAFTNTIKHHQLIDQRSTISFVEGRHGGKVVDFTYYNHFTGALESYEAHWVEDVLRMAVSVGGSLVSCGRALNRQCLGD